MPALMPSASPFCDFGKKKPMFAIEDEKFAPAMPMPATSTTKVSYVVEVSVRAFPRPISGMSSRAVEMNVQLRPPTIAGR